MAFNQSAIKSYRRCQKQFSFRHDYAPEGKELVRKVSSLPLTRGSWMHSLQEELHKEWAGIEGADWRKRQKELTSRFNKLFDEEKAILGDLPEETSRMFRAYLRHWREDRELYSVVEVDGKPAIEMTLEVSLEKWGLEQPFKGKIDLMIQDNEYGGLWIWDGKWVKTLPNADEAMMSPQALVYTWALRKMGYDIRGFVFNYGRTKPPTIPPVLQRGLLTTRKSLDSDYWTYLEAIKRLHGDKWRLYAKKAYITKLRELQGREALWFYRARIPVETPRVQRALGEYIISAKQIEARYKGKHVPRTFMRSCRWDCDYYGPCVAEFNGLDIKNLLKTNYITVKERYAEEEDEDRFLL